MGRSYVRVAAVLAAMLLCVGQPGALAVEMPEHDSASTFVTAVGVCQIDQDTPVPEVTKPGGVVVGTQVPSRLWGGNVPSPCWGPSLESLMAGAVEVARDAKLVKKAAAAVSLARKSVAKVQARAQRSGAAKVATRAGRARTGLAEAAVVLKQVGPGVASAVSTRSDCICQAAVYTAHQQRDKIKSVKAAWNKTAKLAAASGDRVLARLAKATSKRLAAALTAARTVSSDLDATARYMLKPAQPAPMPPA